ncbi:MAG: hypothetical protein ACI9LE_000617, partial [Paraglaciecola sp.]
MVAVSVSACFSCSEALSQNMLYLSQMAFLNKFNIKT